MVDRHILTGSIQAAIGIGRRGDPTRTKNFQKLKNRKFFSRFFKVLEKINFLTKKFYAS